MTRYRTPEARAWVKIAESFDRGEQEYGLCRAACDHPLPENYHGNADANPIKRFESDKHDTYYWPNRFDDGVNAPERVWAALLIAAMCDTGDAYPTGG